MRVVTLIPFRAQGKRERILHYLLPLIRTTGFPVYLADSSSRPFSSAQATNRAAELAAADGGWDLALIQEADVYVECEQIIRTLSRIELEFPEPPMVYTYDHELRLSQLGTIAFLGGKRASWLPSEITRESPPAPMTSGGGPRFVSRQLWEAVGGFDERFIGWGPEDQAFAYACQEEAGPALRMAGTMLNLWHARPVNPEIQARRKANHELYRHIIEGATSYRGGYIPP